MCNGGDDMHITWYIFVQMNKEEEQQRANQARSELEERLVGNDIVALFPGSVLLGEQLQCIP